MRGSSSTYMLDQKSFVPHLLNRRWNKTFLEGYNGGKQIMTNSWFHQRDVVVKLHQAHADYIENTYTNLAAVTGNPHQIEIKRIDGVRVFRSGADSFTNRAIFTGLESPKTVQTVIDYIRQSCVPFYVEVTPANFHPDAPEHWRSPLVKMLLDTGFWPGAFRCVWRYAEAQEPVSLRTDFRIAPIYHDQLASHWDAILEASETKPEDADAIKMHLQGESTEGWIHYLGYEADVPVRVCDAFCEWQKWLSGLGLYAARLSRSGLSPRHDSTTRERCPNCWLHNDFFRERFYEFEWAESAKLWISPGLQ